MSIYRTQAGLYVCIGRYRICVRVYAWTVELERWTIA